MPEERHDPTEYVYTFAYSPNIKRDGTAFDSSDFTSGTWMRFQRGRPRKMGGFRRTFLTPRGIPRQLITQTVDGVAYIFVGSDAGIDAFTASASFSDGAGPFPVTILNTYGQQTCTATASGATSFTVAGDKSLLYTNGRVVFGSETSTTIFNVTNVVVAGTSPNQTTTVTVSGTIPTGTTQVWRYLNASYAFTKNDQRLWKFDVLWNQQKTQGQLLAHGSLNLDNVDSARVAPTWYGDFIANQFQWTLRPLADTGGQTPTYQPILSDGGVLAMYPFILVYGSNGFIKINNVSQTRSSQTFEDWNGALAQEANVAGTKIISASLVRGGQNSPSALLYSADGVVRLSFQPNAGGANPLYWVSDQIAAKISIISANSVVQIGNEYLWMGVDRWYRFNGTVQGIPNNKNTNYVFDNLNFSQRQKVWGLSVPRFNEVWWFYPSGISTECNRAVIYKYQVGDEPGAWYDAGESDAATQNDGVRRCAGYVSEVFPRPFACGYEQSSDVGSPIITISQPTTTPPVPAYTTSSFWVSGDLTPTFAPGYYISLTANGTLTSAQTTAGITVLPQIASATYYSKVGTTVVNATYVTTSTPINSSVIQVGSLVYPATASGYPVWEHELINSYNKIEGTKISSIYSAFETNNISWVSGEVVQQSPRGANYLIRVKRIEPDFKQTGNMKVTFVRRRYARSQPDENVSFIFNSTTERLDTTGAQGRLVNLRFESDSVDGFYEMGKLLLQVTREDQTP